MKLTTRSVTYYNEKKEKKSELIETFKSQIDFAIGEINSELENIEWYEGYRDIIEIKRID